ncbi:MAG: cbb3-type cytochrome c oxidase subunit 3 [Venatoribacter sp.]
MDINDVRGLSSIFALIAFSAVIWWAYGSSRKKRFEEDGNIPFDEDD